MGHVGSANIDPGATRRGGGAALLVAALPQTRIAAIVKGRRRISADTALRLSRYFRMSDRFFVNLQAHYDLEVEKMKLGRTLEREIQPRPEIAADAA